ncbi:OLC1v1033183C1 [Oldenlandia corymbosa var. corymbosa]|uniref:OLC1v1033183C1 n=1 Tax=Oldenlandia corymbosa var. corymbosa TaxID=529605 RepID=A0AAV1CNL3_OLDCO|nr:OLC1v1033183C1 [Oldenlandia corymbosa var. corymbosa]
MKNMWISIMPEELWIRILEIGICGGGGGGTGGGCLNFRDLCSLSITCKRLNSLSNLNFLWSALLSADYNFNTDSIGAAEPTSSCSSDKALYRIRYERQRDQKRLAHRRVVLRFESDVAVSSRKIATMEEQSANEREKMSITMAELLNLCKVKQASVALNVWQPEVIRGKQKQMVQQHDVTINSRISALEMELRLCKQHVANYEIALKVERQKLDRAKEKLESVKYHPLHDFSCKSDHSDEHTTRRKKLKLA